MGCGLSNAHANPEVLVFHGVDWSSNATRPAGSRPTLLPRWVSRKCVKIWIDRHAAEGDAGLTTPSSRPLDADADQPEVERKVLAARAQDRGGPTSSPESRGPRADGALRV